MGILSTAGNAIRGFLIAAFAAAAIMLVHLQHEWNNFLFNIALLMGIIWVGSLLINSFVDIPNQGAWRPIAIAIHACILGIFTTLIMVLLFYGGELTPGVFMFFDYTFLVLIVSNCLIMIVATFLGYVVVPDPEIEMAAWNEQH